MPVGVVYRHPIEISAGQPLTAVSRLAGIIDDGGAGHRVFPCGSIIGRMATYAISDQELTIGASRRYRNASLAVVHGMAVDTWSAHPGGRGRWEPENQEKEGGRSRRESQCPLPEYLEA